MIPTCIFLTVEVTAVGKLVCGFPLADAASEGVSIREDCVNILSVELELEVDKVETRTLLDKGTVLWATLLAKIGYPSAGEDGEEPN
jgi:hypothetical protein